MPLPASPPKIADSPFASMRGHHMGIRYPDFEKARAFWVDIVNEPFEIDAISARLAFFRDPWGNMFELSERIS